MNNSHARLDMFSAQMLYIRITRTHELNIHIENYIESNELYHVRDFTVFSYSHFEQFFNFTIVISFQIVHYEWNEKKKTFFSEWKTRTNATDDTFYINFRFTHYHPASYINKNQHVIDQYILLLYNTYCRWIFDTQFFFFLHRQFNKMWLAETDLTN